MRFSYYFDDMQQVCEVTHVTCNNSILVIQTSSTGTLYVNCDDDRAATALMRDLVKTGYASAPESMQVSTVKTNFEILPAPELDDYLDWFKKLPAYVVSDLYEYDYDLVRDFILLDKSSFENFSKAYLDLLCVNYPSREFVTHAKKSTARKLCTIYSKAFEETLDELHVTRRSIYQYLIAYDVKGLCQNLTESEAYGLLLVLKGECNE